MLDSLPDMGGDILQIKATVMLVSPFLLFSFFAFSIGVEGIFDFYLLRNILGLQ